MLRGQGLAKLGLDFWFLATFLRFALDTYSLRSLCLTYTCGFHPFFSAYYRGAMGILLVYDVTDEASFNNIRNWIRNIEQHASDNVNKILVGNKADMDESKRVSKSPLALQASWLLGVGYGAGNELWL